MTYRDMIRVLASPPVDAPPPTCEHLITVYTATGEYCMLCGADVT